MNFIVFLIFFSFSALAQESLQGYWSPHQTVCVEENVISQFFHEDRKIVFYNNGSLQLLKIQNLKQKTCSIEYEGTYEKRRPFVLNIKNIPWNTGCSLTRDDIKDVADYFIKPNYPDHFIYLFFSHGAPCANGLRALVLSKFL